MNAPYDEPAFPISGGLHNNQFNGMSLRDYFAAKAMQAYVSRPEWMPKELSNKAGCDFDSLMARYAYEMADAMLKARGVAQAQPEADTMSGGWIEWGGLLAAHTGPAALPPRVSLRFRDGDEHDNCNPLDYSWRDRGQPDDIVAYRVAGTGGEE